MLTQLVQTSTLSKIQSPPMSQKSAPIIHTKRTQNIANTSAEAPKLAPQSHQSEKQPKKRAFMSKMASSSFHYPEPSMGPSDSEDEWRSSSASNASSASSSSSSIEIGDKAIAPSVRKTTVGLASAVRRASESTSPVNLSNRQPHVLNLIVRIFLIL